MVLVTFNKDVNDKEKKKLIKAGTPVEMTLKRADEALERYEDLTYERVGEKDNQVDETQKDKEPAKKSKEKDNEE